jgi:DNA polymerase epsilon subunit 1
MFIYSTGQGNRGVLSYHTPHDGNGAIIFIRPRGSQLSPDARQTLATRTAATGLNMTMEGVDSWEGAYARLQRMLPAVQSSAKGPLLALAQTKHTAGQLQALVPALQQMPVVSVPHNNSDGVIWENGALLLGGAWQPAAIELTLDRYEEILPWLANRAALSRFAGLPLGCLPPDDKVFACDVLMHRRLLQSGHLSWLSPTPAPDLGGHPAIATDGGGAQEIDSPEVSCPGMYRVVCVDLQLDNLAVNTVLESRSLHALEGVDLSKDLVLSAETGDAAALAAASDGTSGSPADDSAACASAFRTLKHLVHDWMRSVLDERDPMADNLLLNMYRWLCSPGSLMYDPALHRMVHVLMKKVWLQLLAEIRSLGARVVYASFTRITIATEKASLHDGRAYLDFLLGSVTKKPIFSFLRLTPVRLWSTLLFLDCANYGGIGHRSEEAPVEAPAEAPVEEMELDQSEGAAEAGAVPDGAAPVAAEEGSMEESAEPSGESEAAEPIPQQTPAHSDRASAMTVGVWNLGYHLPPAVQKAFRTMIDLYVAEPWTKAAIAAEERGRDAPELEEVEEATKVFFDDYFSMRLIEHVHNIRKTIPSTGDAERLAVRDGTATDDVVARTFPLLPGSHLEMTDPALEFAKAVCHLASLERSIEKQLLRLRRNILRQLGVREFALEGVWHNPSLSFTLPEVQCDFCGHCRDLDVCREADWACGECGNAYNHEALESRLVGLVQRRALAYQLQDVECAKCRQVKVKNLAPYCHKCAGPFALRIKKESVVESLRSFNNIAHYHEMPWLAEIAAFYQRGL